MSKTLIALLGLALTCSQTPLGPGWEKFAGPYRDARCEIRKNEK